MPRINKKTINKGSTVESEIRKAAKICLDENLYTIRS